MNYYPLPIPDPSCEWGSVNCLRCGINKPCYGHFLTPELALQSASTSAMAKPPSQIIKEAFTELNGELRDEDIRRLSRTTLLPPEEVEMWIEHLTTIKRNRKRGAEKLHDNRRRLMTSATCACVDKSTQI